MYAKLAASPMSIISFNSKVKKAAKTPKAQWAFCLSSLVNYIRCHEVELSEKLASFLLNSSKLSHGAYLSNLKLLLYEIDINFMFKTDPIMKENFDFVINCIDNALSREG